MQHDLSRGTTDAAEVRAPAKLATQAQPGKCLRQATMRDQQLQRQTVHCTKGRASLVSHSDSACCKFVVQHEPHLSPPPTPYHQRIIKLSLPTDSTPSHPVAGEDTLRVPIDVKNLVPFRPLTLPQKWILEFRNV